MLSNIVHDFNNIIKNDITKYQKQLLNIKNNLKQIFNEEFFTLNNIKNEIKENLIKNKEKLNFIKKSLDMNLKGIHIFKNKNELLTPEEIIVNDDLYIQWNNKRFRIKVIS